MSRFVLDCSMTMSWCFEDEDAETSQSVLDRFQSDEAVVPTIWPLEVANVLSVSERKGRLKSAEIARFISILTALPITVDEDTSQHALGNILTLARKHQRTSYDAAYLELAMRLGLPLATLDNGMRQIARKLGIKRIPT